MIGSVSNAGQYYGYYQYSGNMKNEAVQVRGSENAGMSEQASEMQIPVEKAERMPIVQQKNQNGIPFLRKGA